MAKRKGGGSFSHRHGTKHPMSKSQPNPVTEQQLGHRQQLPVNPPTPEGSPLLNPGDPGHPMGLPGRLGEAMGNDPSGPEFY